MARRGIAALLTFASGFRTAFILGAVAWGRLMGIAMIRVLVLRTIRLRHIMMVAIGSVTMVVINRIASIIVIDGVAMLVAVVPTAGVDGAAVGPHVGTAFVVGAGFALLVAVAVAPYPVVALV